MSDAPTHMENDVIERRRNPLVLAGCGVTAGVLIIGLLAFKQGNSALSQRMMRARVLAQAGTVALMVGTSAFATMGTKESSLGPKNVEYIDP